MFSCPHCGARSISAWGKFHASSTFPVACSSCGGLSDIPFRWWSAFAALVPDLLFWGSIVAAIALRNWLCLLAFPVGLLFFVYASNSVTVLQATQTRAVTAARWSALRQIVASALCVVVAYLLFGRQ
jgi:hypothetical protein